MREPSPEIQAAVAAQLREAETALQPILPFAHELGVARIDSAYGVQRINVNYWREHGRRKVGRKIGLTSKTVQQQLGVDQPDYGTLFSDMEILHGESVRRDRLIAPRVEGEIALILERDLVDPDTTMAQMMQSVAFAVPALEIVDSRIKDWKITIVDTIADNGASSRYVLGLEPRGLKDLDLENCGMTLYRNGEVSSVGTGSACLGHPLKAALWLARILVQRGEPLRAGDLILTGALGPMVEARAGDLFESRITGFPSVRLHIG
jgi:2-keto-4-pentenoate hydratase